MPACQTNAILLTAHCKQTAPICLLLQIGAVNYAILLNLRICSRLVLIAMRFKMIMIRIRVTITC